MISRFPIFFLLLFCSAVFPWLILIFVSEKQLLTLAPATLEQEEYLYERNTGKSYDSQKITLHTSPRQVEMLPKKPKRLLILLFLNGKPKIHEQRHGNRCLNSNVMSMGNQLTPITRVLQLTQGHLPGTRLLPLPYPTGKTKRLWIRYRSWLGTTS